MPWQTPKTNWAVGDGVSNSDFNRIEGNIEWLKSNVDSMIGEISFVGRTTLRGRELKCNGAAISRTIFLDLFSVIGTTFGSGDGSTTFNLPDLRGEFIRSWDDARGIDSGRVLGSGQSESINVDVVGGGKGLGIDYQNAVIIKKESGAPVGSSLGRETRPRNIALMAVIKF